MGHRLALLVRRELRLASEAYSSRFRPLVRKRIMPPPKLVDGQPLHDLEAVRAAFRALPTADDDDPVAVNTWEDIDNAT
jgi:hypothetical protein